MNPKNIFCIEKFKKTNEVLSIGILPLKLKIGNVYVRVLLKRKISSIQSLSLSLKLSFDVKKTLYSHSKFIHARSLTHLIFILSFQIKRKPFGGGFE